MLKLETDTHIIIGGEEIALLVPRGDYYKLLWPVQTGDEEVITAAIEFIDSAMIQHGEQPNAVGGGKAFREGVSCFNHSGEGQAKPLIAIRDKRFTEEMREFDTAGVRINTRYGDILYGYDPRVPHSQKSLLVASHLDLRTSLAHFIARTASTQATEPEIEAALNFHLPPPTLRVG